VDDRVLTIAERVGLPGVLAHGMLTMGLAVETIVEWLGDSGRILEYGVRFTRPVVVDSESGADVTVVAKVGAVDDDTVRIDLTVSHEGTTVLGKAQVRVRAAS
jgi:acyl dehydratase